MTLLNENFDDSVLSGYRSVLGGYSVQHKNLRSMRQTGEVNKIPLHFLSRFSVSDLSENHLSSLAFNQRRPGDGWDSVLGDIVERNLPGMHSDLGFVCIETGINDFVSTVARPVFAYPKEPASYDVDTSAFSSSDLLYMTITELDSGIDLSQSWVMLSDVPNAPLGDPSWRMASMNAASIVGSHLSLPLSSFSSVPNIVSAVRIALMRTTSSGTPPAMYVSELGIRNESADWEPMMVNTFTETLERSAGSFDGEIAGPLPVSQPQMIWANEDDSRALVLGGITSAEFNTGYLPYAETGSIRFLGGNSVVMPTFNANTTHPITGEFSIACWVKLRPESFQADRVMGIVSKYVEPWDDVTETYQPSHGDYRLGVDPDGHIVFQLSDETTVAANDPIEPNVWYHIVVVRNGSSLQFYLNGELVDEATVSAGIDTDSSVPFAIATWSTES